MQRNTAVWTPVLALLFISLSLVMPAVAATGYVGSDDAEFGFPSSQGASPISAQVSAQAVFSSAMQYTVGGGGYVILQYNPDWDTSKQYQTGPWYGGADWFQTVIYGISSSNCAIFSIEVYNTFWGSGDWSWRSNGGACTTVNGIFITGAQWYVDEYTNTNTGGSGGKIDAVSFYVVGGTGGGSYYYTENTPTNWYWLRSNVCWCGTTQGGVIYNPTFTIAKGGLNYKIAPACSQPGCVWIGPSFGTIGPPIDIGTAENSNMQYSCMTKVSSVYYTQNFDLNGHC